MSKQIIEEIISTFDKNNYKNSLQFRNKIASDNMYALNHKGKHFQHNRCNFRSYCRKVILSIPKTLRSQSTNAINSSSKNVPKLKTQILFKRSSAHYFLCWKISPFTKRNRRMRTEEKLFSMKTQTKIRLNVEIVFLESLWKVFRFGRFGIPKFKIRLQSLQMYIII